METPSLFSFFAIQMARIEERLKPPSIHMRGPKRPDLQEQERLMVKKGPRGGNDR